jgi:RimJ/RimL family protein N-acetyltransferase
MTTTMLCDTIAIRPYELSDANDIYMAINESLTDMKRWMPWCHSGYSVHDAINWIMEQDIRRERGSAYEFAIVGLEKQYLGGCGVNQVNNEYRMANLGYWVRTSATGQGVATRAVQLVSKWALTSTDLVRLELVIATRNIASLRVAEKAGASLEGLQRSRLLLDGTAHDAMMYSIIRDDLTKRLQGEQGWLN